MLEGGQNYVDEACAIYRKRRDAFLSAIAPLQYPVEPPKATIYVWLPISRRATDSMAFTRTLLDQANVTVAPGSGFGQAGEGWVRVALCDTEDRLREAGERMAKAGLAW